MKQIQIYLGKKTTLIEYSAFFGSIQIFKYLFLDEVELIPPLWFYSIHGKDPEIISILEDNKIPPPNSSYLDIFKDSIKFHNKDITNYIRSNLINEKEIELELEKTFDNVSNYCFHYYNFRYINEYL